ncbi:MAG: hypothetical protein K9N49_06775 [Candidatus Marinimicrobia bacterium]|nr:hypothetical protein [Candidatus Neomarinimicrobiota bacterium]
MKHQLKIAPFSIDITPPVGAPLAYVPNDKVDSPIYVRGLVLDDGQNRVVWAVADIIFYWGKAYHETRALLAKAAQTTAAKVFLHAVHQHDSMFFALELNPYYERFNAVCIPPDYYHRVNRDLRLAVEQAVRPRGGSWRRVVRISTTERRVAGLASNRRLLGANGKCTAMRFSMCTDEAMKQKPVGVIDPLLRTVAFHAQGDRLVAAMHFYASHPMGAYRRNQVGADIPGVALDYVTRHTDAEALHLYFTGCGGNITFGKYHLNSDKTIRVLGERLGRYMLDNMHGLIDAPIGPLTFKTARFELPLKGDMDEALLARKIAAARNPLEVSQPGRRMVFLKQWKQWRQPTVSRMSIGPDVHFLSLPGETVVEYQLYAQGLIPERFLATAAYGDCSYHYIPTAAMYDEGGYEPVQGAICSREVEAPYRQAISKVLEGLR